MANAFDTETEAGGGGPPPAGTGGAPGGGGPGGPPPGGGPMLAALARNQGGQPQISSPGGGNVANAMNQLNMAIQGIQAALPGLPQGSPLHRDALQAVTRLTRHLPQGAPTEGVQQTGFRDLLRQLLQNSFLGRIMQQLQGGGQGQRGQGPDTGAGPSPNLAMQGTPSTPLPGA